MPPFNPPCHVDDFAITIASKSAQQYALFLQTTATEIQTIGLAIEVGFFIPKTELMHWTTVRNRIPPPQIHTYPQLAKYSKPNITFDGWDTGSPILLTPTSTSTLDFPLPPELLA
jgi:hypothetical protein